MIFEEKESKLLQSDTSLNQNFCQQEANQEEGPLRKNQILTNLMQKEMNQMQSLQEEEELLNSKERQEVTRKGVHRRENQMISTSCHNMLAQVETRKNLMQVIMRI